MIDFVQRLFKKNLKHLWGVFYVMTETIEKEDRGRLPLLKGVFLLYIDAAQVMRVMTQPGYGWSNNIFTVTQYFDLFRGMQRLVGSMFTKVVSDGEIPQYIFFTFASFLVLAAVADIFHVMRLFASGHVEKMWPVKTLVILVEAMVTTGFSTIFGWMLVPIRCLVMPDNYKSISKSIRNDPNAPCTPWDWPEIIITVPAIILIVNYMAFALTTSLLTFALNPLSRQARARCTGRVEFYYSIFQFTCAFGTYFTEFTSPIATNLVIFVYASCLFVYHRSFLPFNNHIMNCVRGGFLLVYSWVGGTSTVLLIWMYSQGIDYKSLDIMAPEQFAQWAILAGTLPTFLLGNFFIHWRRKGLYEVMIQLYGEYQVEQRKLLEEQQNMVSTVHGEDGWKTQRSFAISSNAATEPMAHRVTKRSQHEIFFDRNSESKVVFRTWVHCHAAARTFLFRRDDCDLKFLNFIIKKGLQEHPTADGLIILHIQMLRFVFRNPVQAAAQEKIFRVGGKVPDLDNQYTLYSLERKLFQERACSDMGQDAVRAIDLMEFNLGLQTARTAHLAAVSNIKQFWRILSKRTLKSQVAEELMQKLELYEANANKARQEYSWMLEKYSNSAQLLREWALFCDTVLNDEKGAQDSRLQAITLENQINDARGDAQMEGSDLDGGRARTPSQGNGSSLSESTESRRITILRFFQKITPFILGHERQRLSRFHRHVQLFVLILVIIETIAFAFAVVFVFSDVATLDIRMISFISLFRAHVASCGFFQRTSMLAAWKGDQAMVDGNALKITNLSRQVEIEHWNLYQQAQGGMKEHLDSIKFSVQIPVDKVWMSNDFVYFDLIFDYVRRMRSSTKTTLSDWASPEFGLGKISEAKAEVAYVQENLYRSVTEVFESLLLLYDEQLAAFISLATSLVIVISGLTAAVVVFFGSFLLSGVLSHVQTLQYKLVICSMGFAVPRKTSKRLYKHFQVIEHTMKALQDEKIERQDPAQLDLEFDVNQEMQDYADDGKMSGKSDSREEPGSDQGQTAHNQNGDQHHHGHHHHHHHLHEPHKGQHHGRGDAHNPGDHKETVGEKLLASSHPMDAHLRSTHSEGSYVLSDKREIGEGEGHDTPEGHGHRRTSPGGHGHGGTSIFALTEEALKLHVKHYMDDLAKEANVPQIHVHPASDLPNETEMIWRGDYTQNKAFNDALASKYNAGIRRWCQSGVSPIIQEIDRRFPASSPDSRSTWSPSPGQQPATKESPPAFEHVYRVASAQSPKLALDGSGSIAGMPNAPAPLKSALKPVSQRRKRDDQVKSSRTREQGGWGVGMVSGRPSPVAEIAQLRSLINEVEYSTKSSRNTSPTRRQYGGGVSPTRSLHSVASVGGSEVPSRSTSPVNANDAGPHPMQRRVSFARKDRKQATSPGQKRSLKRRGSFEVPLPGIKQILAQNAEGPAAELPIGRTDSGGASSRQSGSGILEQASSNDSRTNAAFRKHTQGSWSPEPGAARMRSAGHAPASDCSEEHSIEIEFFDHKGEKLLEAGGGGAEGGGGNRERIEKLFETTRHGFKRTSSSRAVRDDDSPHQTPNSSSRDVLQGQDQSKGSFGASKTSTPPGGGGVGMPEGGGGPLSGGKPPVYGKRGSERVEGVDAGANRPSEPQMSYTVEADIVVGDSALADRTPGGGFGGGSGLEMRDRRISDEGVGPMFDGHYSEGGNSDESRETAEITPGLVERIRSPAPKIKRMTSDGSAAPSETTDDSTEGLDKMTPLMPKFSPGISSSSPVAAPTPIKSAPLKGTRQLSGPPSPQHLSSSATRGKNFATVPSAMSPIHPWKSPGGSNQHSMGVSVPSPQPSLPASDLGPDANGERILTGLMAADVSTGAVAGDKLGSYITADNTLGLEDSQILSGANDVDGSMCAMQSVISESDFSHRQSMMEEDGKIEVSVFTEEGAHDVSLAKHHGSRTQHMDSSRAQKGGETNEESDDEHSERQSIKSRDFHHHTAPPEGGQVDQGGEKKAEGEDKKQAREAVEIEKLPCDAECANDERDKSVVTKNAPELLIPETNSSSETGMQDQFAKVLEKNEAHNLEKVNMGLMGTDVDFKKRSADLVPTNEDDEMAGNSSMFTRMWQSKKAPVQQHAKPDAHVSHKAHKDSKLHSGDEVEDRGAVAGGMWARIRRSLNLHVLDHGHFYLKKTVEELLPHHMRESNQSDDIKNGLVQAVYDRRIWHQSFYIYVIAILCMLVLSVFCAVYPVEKVAAFVNSASTLNHASRRRYLVKNIVHLTREMVLDDGFSRFDKNQMTKAIDFYQKQFIRSDLAVRKGGVFGIRTGADDHNEEHNRIMYTAGCPWRDDPTNCTIPFLPGVGQSGLYQIIAAFNDAVVKSLTRYGSSRDQWPDDWKGKAGETARFSNVTLKWDMYKKMMTDVKLQFVLDSFEGDVSQGLSLISQILEDEAFRNLDNGVRDNNTLYAVHIIATIIGFYLLLFRHTIYKAHGEIRKARHFVLMMPFYILPPEDVEHVVDFFKNGEQDMDDMDMEEVDVDKEGGEDIKEKDEESKNNIAEEGSSKRRSKYAKLLEQLGGDAALDNDLTALYANLQTADLTPAGDPLSGKGRSPGGLRKSSTITGGLTSPGRSPVVALQPSASNDGQQSIAAASLASMTQKRASQLQSN